MPNYKTKKRRHEFDDCPFGDIYVPYGYPRTQSPPPLFPLLRARRLCPEVNRNKTNDRVPLSPHKSQPHDNMFKPLHTARSEGGPSNNTSTTNTLCFGQLVWGTQQKSLTFVSRLPPWAPEPAEGFGQGV